jgi:hypothetical protein
VTETGIVYGCHFGVFRRLELSENESLIRAAIYREVRQSVDVDDVEDDDVALMNE